MAAAPEGNEFQNLGEGELEAQLRGEAAAPAAAPPPAGNNGAPSPLSADLSASSGNSGVSPLSADLDSAEAADKVGSLPAFKPPPPPAGPPPAGATKAAASRMKLMAAQANVRANLKSKLSAKGVEKPAPTVSVVARLASLGLGSQKYNEEVEKYVADPKNYTRRLLNNSAAAKAAKPPSARSRKANAAAASLPAGSALSVLKSRRAGKTLAQLRAERAAGNNGAAAAAAGPVLTKAANLRAKMAEFARKLEEAEEEERQLQVEVAARQAEKAALDKAAANLKAALDGASAPPKMVKGFMKLMASPYRNMSAATFKDICEFCKGGDGKKNATKKAPPNTAAKARTYKKKGEKAKKSAEARSYESPPRSGSAGANGARNRGSPPRGSRLTVKAATKPAAAPAATKAAAGTRKPSSLESKRRALEAEGISTKGMTAKQVRSTYGAGVY